MLPTTLSTRVGGRLLGDDHTVYIEYIDTGGNDDYTMSLAQTWIEKSTVFILFIDLSLSINMFDTQISQIKTYIDIICNVKCNDNNQNIQNIPIIIVGTKSDLWQKYYFLENQNNNNNNCNLARNK